MRRFFENKLAFAAILFLFALAFTANLIQGAEAPRSGQLQITLATFAMVHGPTMPPDPWIGVALAHGPTIPPDPWIG